jgi:TonB family protein
MRPVRRALVASAFHAAMALVTPTAVATVISVTSWTSSARAAGAEASKPKWVAPRQIDAPPPVYPEGGQGDATVLVELVVEADGSVSSARAIEGEEPFATAAVEAALRFRFDPATRDGTPARVTIRASIRFEAPHVETPPPEAPEATKPKPATPGPTPTKPPPITIAPPPPDEPIELTVEGERHEIATTAVGRAEVRVLPGAFGDPFRVIEALPGVTPIVSGLPYFYVRGAPPGNTGYFLDGMRVPLLFHVGAGPSVIAAGMIDRVDFWSGGYPAGYGRFSGGIVAGVTKPPAKEIHGEWVFRLFDASAMIEVPLGGAPGREATALVAGRYGYPGLLLSLFSPDASLAYWDYQLRVSKQLSDRDRLSVFAFGAYDSLYDKKHDKQLLGTQFHRVDLRLDHALDAGAIRLATTVGYERTGIGESDSSSDRDVSVANLGARMRVELDERLRPEVLLRAGGDLSLERFELFAGSDSNGRDARQLLPSRVDLTTGVWADLVIHPGPGVELVPGVRFDLYRSQGLSAPAFEPRLAARVKIAPAVSWLAALGLAHQMPAFFVPVSGLQPGIGRGLQESWQFSTGAEVRLPWKITGSLVGFRHAFRQLSDLLATCVDRRASTANSDCDIDERATGQSYGLEAMVKRDLGERFGFWITYTLSRTTRTFRGETFASQFDRTHVLSVIGSVILGKGWRFGARYSYVTGRPVTASFHAPDVGSPPSAPIESLGPRATLPAGSPDAPSVADLERYFTVRLPSFQRLDVRLEKRWDYANARWVAFTVEWFNATLSKEAVNYSCDYLARCEIEEIGPVTIPSLGLEGGF